MRRIPMVVRALGVLACAAAALAGGAPAGAAVTTGSGPVEGVAGEALTKYLGIPYAAPPVGELRWRPPQAPKPWQATREAAAFGARCPQTAAVGEFSAPSAAEDCLFLNVFVPSTAKGPAPAKGAAGAKRPVMVWIPGGGFFAGASNDYDPTSLVTVGDVVFVSLNYRVGLLGFFSQADIDAEGHPSGNYGFLDQQLALRWVHDNIAAFGGDPDNVTIFGESAGAISVYGHLASTASKDLFHKAILESGFTDYPKGPQASPRSVITPLAEAKAYGGKFAAAVGCAQGSPKDIAACLRALPVDKIINQQFPFIAGLIIGGASVPEPFDPLLREGTFNRVPVINGTNHDEWRWPLARTELRTGHPLTAERYPGELSAFFGEAAAKVGGEYPAGRFGSPSEALAAAETDEVFACGALRNDGWMARYVPVYGYEFNDAGAPMYMPSPSFPYGAAHTVELQFVFPGFHGGRGAAHPLTPAESALSLAMVRYWSNFARTGDPNGPGVPAWPRMTPEAETLQSLSVPAPAPLGAAFAADHRCRFWSALK